MIQSPCLDCDKKGCGKYHDECEAYKMFREQQLKEYENRRKIKGLKSIINKYAPRSGKPQNSPIKCHKK